MLRALAVFAALLAVASLEFIIYPGHSYLASSSQLYLPILQHLSTPGYLTRDLVATHPNVTYSDYDELTLFLHAASTLDFRRVLEAQQVLCRLAGVIGVFLLARATGLRPAFAVLIAALVNCGPFLRGAEMFLIDREPVPEAFALGYVLLAMGLLARAKPLLATLFGGIGFLYDPSISTPFWMMLLLAFLFDGRIRKLLRPAVPVFLVFILLLANLAQLQPGIPDMQPLSNRFSHETAAIMKWAVPDVWVSLWPTGLIYCYLAALVITVWAVTRIWPALNMQTKWMFCALPVTAVLSLPLSSILLERYHWSLTLRVRPLHWLVYLVTVGWFACAIAAYRAIKRSKKTEASAWAAICLLVLTFNTGTAPVARADRAVTQLARWADNQTWGSSVFAFPDAGRAPYPGVFRAESRRALWVDWESRRQMIYHVDMAGEWWTRWRDTMEGPITGEHLQQMLSLPIDYFVFKRADRVGVELAGRRTAVRPVFSNGDFAVYEASTLRIVPGRLIMPLRRTPAAANAN